MPDMRSYDFAQAAEDKRETALFVLDTQLERLQTGVDHLEKMLSPVLSYHSTDKLSIPRDEPVSQLRGRAERLSDLNDALQTIMDRLDI